MTLVEILDQARKSGDFSRFAEAIPYARFLGISAAEREGALISTLAFREGSVGNPALPALHGGVVGAFLETAAIFELLWARETVSLPKTINVTIDYLRPAGPRDCHARGVITKQGRRIANVSVEAWQRDPANPVATANCHFLLQAD